MMSKWWNNGNWLGKHKISDMRFMICDLINAYNERWKFIWPGMSYNPSNREYAVSCSDPLDFDPTPVGGQDGIIFGTKLGLSLIRPQYSDIPSGLRVDQFYGTIYQEILRHLYVLFPSTLYDRFDHCYLVKDKYQSEPFEWASETLKNIASSFRHGDHDYNWHYITPTILMRGLRLDTFNIRLNNLKNIFNSMQTIKHYPFKAYQTNPVSTPTVYNYGVVLQTSPNIRTDPWGNTYNYNPGSRRWEVPSINSPCILPASVDDTEYGGIDNQNYFLNDWFLYYGIPVVSGITIPGLYRLTIPIYPGSTARRSYCYTINGNQQNLIPSRNYTVPGILLRNKIEYKLYSKLLNNINIDIRETASEHLGNIAFQTAYGIINPRNYIDHEPILPSINASIYYTIFEQENDLNANDLNANYDISIIGSFATAYQFAQFPLNLADAYLGYGENTREYYSLLKDEKFPEGLEYHEGPVPYED